MRPDRPVFFGRFSLDPRGGLRRGKREVKLTPRALDLLLALTDRPGQVVTKDELFRSVWQETVVSDAALSSCILELRQALGDDARRPRYIETLHRRGFRFVAAVTALHASAGAAPAMRPSAVMAAPVGRDEVLDQLDGLLERVLAGKRQMVFVTGPPGIGKTTVVDAFLARHDDTGRLRVGHGHCVERYGAGEAYLPVLDALGRLGRARGAEQVVDALFAHAPTWLIQLPALVPAGQRRALARRADEATRGRMLRELTEAMEALAADEPLVLWLEDLHWSDASTLDWLSFLARRPEPARLLVIGTYRPVEVLSSGHALRDVKQELQLHHLCSELALRPLGQAAVAEYLARRFGVDVSISSVLETLARAIHARTDGNPLFMVSVTDDLVAQGILTEREGRWTVSASPDRVPLRVPSSVGEMIERQLDRLGASERRLLEVASVAGGDFSAALVADAAAIPAADVEAACAVMARHEQFLKPSGTAEWPDGTLAARFAFMHALYREVLYERVPAGTRAVLHARVAERLETAHGERAREIAAELAMHFEQGRRVASAVRYFELAGENAIRRSAHAEAIVHLTRALDLLPSLPDTPDRVRREAESLAMLGPAWMAAKGYAAPEVAATYRRALALCRDLRDSPERARAMQGLWNFYLVRSELGTARELGEELLEQARRARDDTLLRRAHGELGQTLFHAGELGAARSHLEQAVAREPSDDLAATTTDPRVLAYLSWVLWLHGFPDQARRRIEEALVLAEQRGRPHQRAFVLGFAALFHQFCRDPETTLRLAEIQDALCREYAYPYWLAWAVMLRGWVLVQEGKTNDGLARIRAGLQTYRATGAEVGLTHLSSLLVEALAADGRVDEAAEASREALALSARNGNCYWDADLLRLNGELHLARADSDAAAAAEAVFNEALAVARRQGALALELRAAVRLARLWAEQDRQSAVRAVLTGIVSRFTEGLGTADLLEARVLLRHAGSV